MGDFSIADDCIIWICQHNQIVTRNGKNIPPSIAQATEPCQLVSSIEQVIPDVLPLNRFIIRCVGAELFL